MNQLKNEFNTLKKLIVDYGKSISKIKKYPGNSHYTNNIKKLFLDINQSLKRIKKLSATDLPFFENVEKLILKLIDKDIKVNLKEKLLEEIELKWQDLDLELDDIKPLNSSHQIPDEIPFTDVRLDLEEALQDFQNGCYLSSIVMCRRAYEGALASKYKKIENKDPIKQVICKHCNNILKGKNYLGITELHKWAIEKKIISDKFKDIGFLIPSLGSGGAHPTESFPRDPDVTNISITTTIALLKQIYSN